jgi:hypothetical protein
MRISRFALRDKPQILLESSVLWKGELASSRQLMVVPILVRFCALTGPKLPLIASKMHGIDGLQDR